MMRVGRWIALPLALWIGQAAADEVPGPVRYADTPILGIGLEGYDYPFPVHLFPLDWDSGLGGRHPVRMAYMDMAPTGKPNGRVALLLHGRNFPASYWEGPIRALTGAGWRVIAPDQIGFGKSSKPEGDWSFDIAAANTLALLDKLGVHQFDLVGHSMGGMLAERLASQVPARVHRLVLEAPLGLEDYKAVVPPVPRAQLLQLEQGLTAEAYNYYLTSSYRPTLTPEQIKPFVELRERMKGAADYPRWVESYVATYYAIWGQPTLELLPKLPMPVLFIVGDRDRTAPGRAYVTKPDEREKLGHVADLAAAMAPKMKQASVVRLDTGHLVHLEQPDAFNAAMLDFLNKN